MAVIAAPAAAEPFGVERPSVFGDAEAKHVSLTISETGIDSLRVQIDNSC